MKLRVRGNSIRLRLTQSEVKEIRAGRGVQETISFANGAAKLHYVLEPSTTAQALDARYDNHRITVLVPQQMAYDWASSEKVEMKNEPSQASENLFILVEKDFVCLKSRTNESEDENDMFPNPNEAHGNCGGNHG
jgi:hypothetical protein